MKRMLEVPLLKIRKVDKEDLYIHLSKEYGWTPDQIASLTPEQQYIYLRGPKVVKVNSMEEYERMFNK